MTYRALTRNTVITFLCVILAIGFEYSGLDLTIEHLFYDETLHTWPYKKLFITSSILHIGGKYFVIGLSVSVFLLFIASFFFSQLRKFSKHILFILIAGLASSLVIGILKNITHIHTPWHLMIFGGDMPYIRIFDRVPSNIPVGHAFPGGHSGSGFALLSLYFGLAELDSRYRYHALLFALVIGITFSIMQEVRGAHFISHDMFSFAICWATCCVLSLVFFGLKK